VINLAYGLGADLNLAQIFKDLFSERLNPIAVEGFKVDLEFRGGHLKWEAGGRSGHRVFFESSLPRHATVVVFACWLSRLQRKGNFRKSMNDKPHLAPVHRVRVFVIPSDTSTSARRGSPRRWRWGTALKKTIRAWAVSLVSGNTTAATKKRGVERL
jgi:hypothetical protein